MMSRLCTLLVAAVVLSALATSSLALDLEFRGTAQTGSSGDVFIYEQGGGPSTSFAGQPIDFSMQVSDSLYGLYVSDFTLSWSAQTYSLPYLVSWAGTGYPYDQSFDGELGVESIVNLTNQGGEIRIFSTPAYIGYYDGGILFDLTYTLSGPHAPNSSFTDNAATGTGTVFVSVNDNFDPNIGPYDAVSNVTFDITSVTSIAAPEPATWAMLLAGSGAVGGLARGRRKRADNLGLVRGDSF